MDNEAASELFTPAAREALKAFPISARDLTLITVSENVTFRVADKTPGPAYVLRLHRPGYHSLAALDSERIWTAALSQAGVAVPSAISTSDGRYYVPVTVPASGERRFAGLAGWTEGEVLSDVIASQPDSDQLASWYEQLGAILAEMHRQSSAWRPPAAFVRHHLDIDGLLGEAPFWGRFWEHPILTGPERSLLLATRQTLCETLARYGRDYIRYGVIHADLHTGNVLINDGRLTVIDFDDTAFGWYMYDIAVALIHQQNKICFPFLRQALLKGYRSVRALSLDHEATLPMFLLIRGMAVIGWLHQRPELSGAQYMEYLERTRSSVVAQCELFTPPC